jgi:hypothetical protein
MHVLGYFTHSLSIRLVASLPIRALAPVASAVARTVPSLHEIRHSRLDVLHFRHILGSLMVMVMLVVLISGRTAKHACTGGETQTFW